MRKNGEVKFLRPDGKTQVTIEYDEENRPLRVDTVLISTQHDPEVSQEALREDLREHVIEPVLDEVLGDAVKHDDYRVLVNPTGSFIMAEPVSINVETYGTEADGVTREQIQEAVRKVFDLRPAAIVDELDLLRPIYSKTAAYGHFGREDDDFTWEHTNKVDELKRAIATLVD